MGTHVKNTRKRKASSQSAFRESLRAERRREVVTEYYDLQLEQAMKVKGDLVSGDNTRIIDTLRWIKKITTGKINQVNISKSIEFGIIRAILELVPRNQTIEVRLNTVLVLSHLTFCQEVASVMLEWNGQYACLHLIQVGRDAPLPYRLLWCETLCYLIVANNDYGYPYSRIVSPDFLAVLWNLIEEVDPNIHQRHVTRLLVIFCHLVNDGHALLGHQADAIIRLYRACCKKFHNSKHSLGFLARVIGSLAMFSQFGQFTNVELRPVKMTLRKWCTGAEIDEYYLRGCLTGLSYAIKGIVSDYDEMSNLLDGIATKLIADNSLYHNWWNGTMDKPMSFLLIEAMNIDSRHKLMGPVRMTEVIKRINTIIDRKGYLISIFYQYVGTFETHVNNWVIQPRHWYGHQWPKGGRELLIMGKYIRTMQECILRSGWEISDELASAMDIASKTWVSVLTLLGPADNPGAGPLAQFARRPDPFVFRGRGSRLMGRRRGFRGPRRFRGRGPRFMWRNRGFRGPRRFRGRGPRFRWRGRFMRFRGRGPGRRGGGQLPPTPMEVGMDD